jgi:hypothetical protein
MPSTKDKGKSKALKRKNKQIKYTKRNYDLTTKQCTNMKQINEIKQKFFEHVKYFNHQQST